MKEGVGESDSGEEENTKNTVTYRDSWVKGFRFWKCGRREIKWWFRKVQINDL